MTEKYYSLEKINEKGATYNVIFGERSNGKTYAALMEGLRRYISTGKQMAYVRRWKEDVTGRRAQRLFAGILENNEVAKLTNGEFTGIHYYSGKWYLCTYDEKKGKPVYHENDIICFSFNLSTGEHDKSTAYPRVGTIIFDEFLTKGIYLPDEFVLFMNTVSTIVRKRTDVTIYMLGNTVNKYAPYFEEMGLKHVREMTPGTIDLYTYGDSKLTIAVEYCESLDGGQGDASKQFFAFDNPKLEMISSGAWEIAIYPHLPYKYRPNEVLHSYYIEFSGEVFEAEIINHNGEVFTYIHRKTTPIREDTRKMVYTLDYSSKMNYNRNILKPRNEFQKRVAWFFQHDRVFYQDNNVGDTIKNYLNTCKKLWT